MAVTVVLDKVLDKEYENKSLAEILAAPPSALAGLTPEHDKALAALRIKSIAELGANKYFQLAATLVELQAKQG